MTEDEQILTAVLNCRRVDLLNREKDLSEEEKVRITDMRSRRLAGEPLQYIIGFTEFMGLPMKVDVNVLIPRPETEFLVEKTISRLKKLDKELSILDLCTGSGNIAIALAYYLPRSRITAVDISGAALEVAKINSTRNGVDKKISFFCSPLDKFIYDNNCGKFDLIISNPPYVPSKKMLELPLDVKAEPKIALDGGYDGLDFYRLMIENAHRFLSADGLLAFETGEDQRHDLDNILQSKPYYTDISFETDLAGKERYLFLKKIR